MSEERRNKERAATDPEEEGTAAAGSTDDTDEEGNAAGFGEETDGADAGDDGIDVYKRQPCTTTYRAKSRS